MQIEGGVLSKFVETNYQRWKEFGSLRLQPNLQKSSIRGNRAFVLGYGDADY